MFAQFHSIVVCSMARQQIHRQICKQNTDVDNGNSNLPETEFSPFIFNIELKWTITQHSRVSMMIKEIHQNFCHFLTKYQSITFIGIVIMLNCFCPSLCVCVCVCVRSLFPLSLTHSLYKHHKTVENLRQKYLPNWKLDLFSFHRQFVFLCMQIFWWWVKKNICLHQPMVTVAWKTARQLYFPKSIEKVEMWL